VRGIGKQENDANDGGGDRRRGKKTSKGLKMAVRKKKKKGAWSDAASIFYGNTKERGGEGAKGGKSLEVDLRKKSMWNN